MKGSSQIPNVSSQIPTRNERLEPNSKRFEPLYYLFLEKGCEGSPSAAVAKR